MIQDSQISILGTPLLWVPAASAFVLSTLLFPPYIKWLKAQQFGQYIREEGPQSHKKKKETPTAGGVLFLFTFVAVLGAMSVLLATDALWGTDFNWRRMLMVTIIGMTCGLVGLADDIAKVKHKTNEGLPAKVRLFFEFCIGIFLGLLLVYAFPAENGNLVYLPGGTMQWTVIWLVPFSAFLVAATTNAYNLHDGMDGLAGGTGFLFFLTMAVMLACVGDRECTVVAVVAASVLLAFLIYNRSPAKIFMGDTGSLFVGGLMASLACAGGLAFWFVPLSLVYIVEAISVILQVFYFKLTKDYKPEKPMSKPALIWLKLTSRKILPGEGKRLFRMTPIHHHFEQVYDAKGEREWVIVAAFWAVQAMICIAVLLAFFATR